VRASRVYIQMVKRRREGQARRRVMHVCEIWTKLDWSGAGLFVETDERRNDIHDSIMRALLSLLLMIPFLFLGFRRGRCVIPRLLFRSIHPNPFSLGPANPFSHI